MSENLTVADVLERAADLIEPEGRWTQKAGARNKHGRVVEMRSKAGVCWCVIGAVQAVTKAGEEDIASRARVFLRQFIGKSYIGPWNDAPERTQAEVVAKLREAAAKARGDAS